ncbi:MAG: hypothetical protein FJ398_18560 [Verrucomicrobia bacterium]|nr:hypothetical protein [Verrucomicrobiota bacterium]
MNTVNNHRSESAVKQRYSTAAKAPEAALCCPVEYNKDLLKIIPQEVIEKDYGCGDPSRYLKRDAQPWQTVAGIEFRSVTVEAFKGKQGDCLKLNQSAVYRGPFREVLDDDGHRLRRGERVAVCDKTFQLYSQPPYAEHFEFIEPRVPVKPEDVKPWDRSRAHLRHLCETKGMDYDASTAPSQCCDGGSCC